MRKPPITRRVFSVEMSQLPLFEKKAEPEKPKENPVPSNIGAWQRVDGLENDDTVGHNGVRREVYAKAGV